MRYKNIGHNLRHFATELYRYCFIFIHWKPYKLLLLLTLNAFAFQAHYMLGLALLQKKEYGKGVKELEKVWCVYFLKFYIYFSFLTNAYIREDSLS